MANEKWSYSQAGLTPAGAALLSIAVAVATSGMGSVETVTALVDAGAILAGAAELERKLTNLMPFRQGLERAFPLPSDWATHAPDALVVCRCENITAGELRACARDAGADEMNRLKALTRVGMGRCQGRMCGVAAAEILAHATGKPIDTVGRLRGQAPIKPIPIHLQPQAEARA